MRPSTAPRPPVRTWALRPPFAAVTRRGAPRDREIAMLGTSWRVGRIAGIQIRVDSSWGVIALLITYSMYLRFSFLYKDLSTGAAAGIAILAAVLFFGSVLAHELAHALVSRARGIQVQDITLFLFGGATRARGESRRPGDQFLIAAGGAPTPARGGGGG